MVCIVLVAVMSIFILRAILVRQQDEGKIPAGSAGYIAAFINAVQIHILNFVYAKVARKLNDWGSCCGSNEAKTQGCRCACSLLLA